MRLLLLATPRFFQIVVGVFGSYLAFFWARTRSLPLLSLLFVFFYTVILVIAGIVGLVELSNSSRTLSRVEHILEELIKLGVAIHTAYLLHPASSIVELIQPPAFSPGILHLVYLVVTLVVASCAVNISLLFKARIPRSVSSTLFIVASSITITLLLAVAFSCRPRAKLSSRCSLMWALLAVVQFSSITIAALNIHATTDAIHFIMGICLLGWVAGTIGVISELVTLSRSSWTTSRKSPGLYTVRRIPHISVSEDFQACSDPFAGPMEMGQLPRVIHSTFSPPIVKSMADSTWYSRSSARNGVRRSRSTLSNSSYYSFGFGRAAAAGTNTESSPMRRITSNSNLENKGRNADPLGDVRRPYLSSSSTGWLLSQSNLPRLPSLPPPALLAPVKSENSYDRFFPPTTPTRNLEFIDRTPTQSIYRSKSSLNVLTTGKLYMQANTSDHFERVNGSSLSSLLLEMQPTGSIPSIPSLFDTPDHTFSSTLIESADTTNADQSLVTQISDILETQSLSGKGEEGIPEGETLARKTDKTDKANEITIVDSDGLFFNASATDRSEN